LKRKSISGLKVQRIADYLKGSAIRRAFFL